MTSGVFSVCRDLERDPLHRNRLQASKLGQISATSDPIAAKRGKKRPDCGKTRQIIASFDVATRADLNRNFVGKNCGKVGWLRQGTGAVQNHDSA
jgi:hypothetical protein